MAKKKRRRSRGPRLAMLALPFLTISSRLPGKLGGSDQSGSHEQEITSMKESGHAQSVISQVEALGNRWSREGYSEALRSDALSAIAEVDGLDLPVEQKWMLKSELRRITQMNR